MQINSELLDEILSEVERPIRYVDGEWNAVHKRLDDVAVRVLLAFPDTYEVGMSHLGLKILYYILNQRDDTACERAFMPWVDMHAAMKARGVPLYSLESHVPASEFDIVGFSLQYELSYTNVLAMLDLAGIPARASARGERDPLVIAGGPCAYNPEPVAPFFDAVLLGEGEEAVGEIVDEYKRSKREGLSRRATLEALARVPGVYVPSLYDVEYRADGKIARIVPTSPAAAYPVRKRVVKDLGAVPFPDKFVVPFAEVIHDRIMLEVFRGCTHGCRFCQAGMVYRPVRERDLDDLCELAGRLVTNTGYEEISLMSLSSADYSRIRELVSSLLERYSGSGVAVSLPSLRVDSFSVDLAKEVERGRKSGLTFAPEAGTQRLRDVINKGVTRDDLIDAARAAFAAGWQNLKLYFMIGLPTETDEDLAGIVDLAKEVLACGREELRRAGAARSPQVTVSVSSFVPKAHTPFQWHPQCPMEELEAKQAYLKRHLRGKGLKLAWHDVRASFLEAVFSRGDRRLAPVLEEAVALGCRFDAWHEELRFEKWQEAFARSCVDPRFYANTHWAYDDVLPWDHLTAGVTKEYLVSESKRAAEGVATPDCRLGRCVKCGVCPELRVAPRILARPVEGVS
ncbi:MAG TPA: TIGR03960 family B12-binding radical SAM protein [Firmicutes bacterium]|nr:TIGR03960 family B12-binding radical SAM protein [Bacillota bacterium]